MHNDVPWMTRVDSFIVDFMARCDDGDAVLSPAVIATNIHYTRSYVGDRLRDELVPNGVVKDTGGGMYRLTELGKEVAAGTADPDDLQEPDA